jgi:Uma2 family endonuclease
MTVEDFLLFLETRPDEEHWDLVEGVAIMMAPPTHAHQRIASNLEKLLNAHFDQVGSDLQAYIDAGVRVAGLDNFMPRPDVGVWPGPAGDTYFSTAFHFVAELPSPSNTRKLIERKLDRYRGSPECRYALVVDARRVWAELHSRGETWTVETLAHAAAPLELPVLGFRCLLGDLYRKTTLDPRLK